MATAFLQSDLDNARYVLTSEVSGIQAQTDKQRIDVSLTCSNGLGGTAETFFSTSLCAFNNVVELSDVGSLVEEYFRLRDKVSDTVNIIFDGVSMAVHFLYCEYSMPDTFNPRATFFLASMVQRVHQDSTVAIAAVDRGSTSRFIIKAVGHRIADDTLAVVEKSVKSNLGSRGITYFGVGEIIQWALNKTDEKVDENLRDVMYFSIVYGGIQKMCYIVPAPAYLTFSFFNAFNIKEYLDVVGEMVTATDVSHGVAVCNGISRHYDRNVGRTYQIQTEPLTTDEVRIFEQFLASHHVAINIESSSHDVIITDHTCEPSTSDDTLTTIKFTWRFADRRPRVFDTLMNGVLPSRRRIFDDTFSPEYG